MKRKMNYFLTPAYALPENIPFQRVGIIPYFIEDTLPSFFLMRDSKFQELTDCGGLPKPGESWMDTAIRETEEESRDKFKFTNEQVMNEGQVFWREDRRIAIVFIDVSCNIPTRMHAAEACYKYRSDYLEGIVCKDKRHRLENSDMFFHTTKEAHNLVKNVGRVYTPVRMLLLKFIRTKMYDHLP